MHDPSPDYLPINLLLKARPCLIVGGGKTAARKATSLSGVGGRVSVVAPAIGPEMQALVDAGTVAWQPKRFEAGDTVDQFVVFAATDIKEVNIEVAEACGLSGALCGVVDAGWQHGDLISSAVLSGRDLTITVSTGGTSCRRARMIKNTLAHHVALFERADVLVLGTDQRVASLAQREQVLPADGDIETIGRRIAHLDGIHEFMLLSTCNRFELIAVAARTEGMEALLAWALGLEDLPDAARYAHWGADALQHLSKTTAGLHAQVLGEHHIVAQVKQSHAEATERGWAGAAIEDLVSSARHTARALRQEILPMIHVGEIEDVCCEALRSAQADELAGSRVAVVGSGKMGRALVKALLRAELTIDWIYMRTAPEALEADGAGRIASIQSWDETDLAAGHYRGILWATSQPELLDAEGCRALLAGKAPPLLLDLGLPRNVVTPDDEELQRHLLNLDDLKSWHRQRHVDAAALEESIARIWGKHAKYYERIMYTLQGRNGSGAG